MLCHHAPLMRRHLALLTVVGLTLSCGRNIFKSSVSKDPAEDATLALEKSDPESAIAILEDALSGDPRNPKFLSILSTALALRAGIDPLVLASKIGSSPSSSLALAATDNLTGLFAFLPAASSDNLRDLDRAVTILTKQISAEQRQPGDVFKSAIYLTASMALHTKALDTSGKGSLSTDDISKLSDTAADLILNNLSTAQSLLASKAAEAGASEATTKAASEKLDNYAKDIAAEPGTTNQEKLRNYLASHPNG